MPIVFEREVLRMRDVLLKVAREAESQVRKSMDALLRGDAVLAAQVIENDRIIDLAEVQAEEDCLKLLALHQPVANDLRLIIAGIKINNDLERIGDHAVSIAQCAKWLSEGEKIEIPEDVARMGKKAKLMLRKSLLSFVEQEVELAWRVLKSDEEVDELHRVMHTWYVDWVKDNASLAQQGLYLVSVAKHLERIADLASNIAEEVIYIRKGEIVRHGRLDSTVQGGKVVPITKKG